MSLTIEQAESLEKPRKLGVARLAVLIALFSASFDLFLVLVVGGFTIRFHQIFVLIAITAALGLMYRVEKIAIPVGATWLMLWTMCIFAFVPNTLYLPRSLGYAVWLGLDVLAIFAVVQLFGNPRWIMALLRGYLIVYLSIGLFGLLQLALGIAHIPAPFVQQWLIYGVWPRINGFSYEPSYYSTYMLMGWVFSAWLVEHEVYVLGRNLTRATFAVSSLAMFLSTSRLGWAMMLVWGVSYAWRRWQRTSRLRIPPILAISGLCLMALIISWAALSQDKLTKHLAFFANGTGLYGTAAHSVVNREKSFEDTIAIVERSPFIGYSLGGVATAIGVMRGRLVTGNADAKHNEGGTVLAEVLAASGIIGVWPFLIYLGLLIWRSLRAGSAVDPETRALLSALVWSFCMELLILQFNQNILRAYFWFHIGVLSACYSAVASGGWRASSQMPSNIDIRASEPVSRASLPGRGQLSW